MRSVTGAIAKRLASVLPFIFPTRRRQLALESSTKGADTMIIASSTRIVTIKRSASVRWALYQRIRGRDVNPTVQRRKIR